MTKISIVVPCYNEEQNIKVFFATVGKIFSKQKKNCELIFIDDGSKDNTLVELKKLKNSEMDIKIISFSRNFGKEAGIYAGLLEATGDYTAIIDADMQQDPLLIAKAIEFLDDNLNYDAVTYCQKTRNEDVVLSLFKQAFYKIVNRLSDIEFTQGASDFRVMRRVVLESILKVNENTRFSKGLFSWVGFNTYYIEYVPNKRMFGKTKWSFWKLFNYAILGIVSFTTAPLRFPVIMGILTLITSFIYGVVLVSQLLSGLIVTINELFILIFLFVSGIQLFSIGILAEYLSKTYMETKNRPVFIVKEKMFNKSNKIK